MTLCLLDKQLVQDLIRINEKNTSIFPLIYWLGYRPVRIPTVRHLRTKGVSQWSTIKKISLALDTLIGFTYAPVRFITFLGITTSLLAFIYLAHLLSTYFSQDSAPPGWMSVIGVILILGGPAFFFRNSKRVFVADLGRGA